jgi:DNA repair protein SbcD/Mre11
VNLGLLHTSVTGREGHEPYAPCTLEGLRAKQYDYWALGHVHKQEILSVEPHVVFSGNIQGRHVRECGPKGCMLVSIDAQGRVAVEPRVIDVFRWGQCWVDASGVQSPQELLDRACDRLRGLVAENAGIPLAVRVELSGPCPAHRQVAAHLPNWTNELRAAAIDVGGGSLWLEKVHVGTTLPADLNEALATDGPIGELARLIDELKSDREALDRLLADELAELRRRLPAELTASGGLPGFDDPQARGELLDQVREMLFSQLASREASR